MQTWASVLFYVLVGYIFFHLVIDDIAHLIIAVRSGSQNPQREEGDSEPDVIHNSQNILHVLNGTVCPAAVLASSAEPDVESQTVNSVFNTTGNTTHNLPIPFVRRVSSAEQRSVVLIAYKICDIVLYCLMGYFHTFTTCWCACINCLNVLILKYLSFLETMVTQMLAYPTVVFLCPTAVLCLAIVCVIVHILVSEL